MTSLLFTRTLSLALATSASIVFAAGACSKSKAQPETETPAAATAEPVAIEEPLPAPSVAEPTGEITYPNLQLFPTDISEENLTTAMKGMADGLGVQCDHCHNVENFGEETELKGKARSMIAMTMSLDQTHLGGKGRLKCMTCHQGGTTPTE